MRRMGLRIGGIKIKMPFSVFVARVIDLLTTTSI